jgi:phospholipase C
MNFDSASVPGPVVNGKQWPGNMCGPGLGDPSGFGTTMDRCGYGPRLPMLVLSPWVKSNTLDSTVISTDAILRFLEDRFAGGQRIGGGSLDTVAGSLAGVFDASRPNLTPVVLNPSSGQPTG